MLDFQTPLAGMNRASASLDRTAARIAASPNPPPGDTVSLSDDMIGLMSARDNFETNVKVAQTEDQMTKSLLNTLG
jgi:hypothetical protein